MASDVTIARDQWLATTSFGEVIRMGIVLKVTSGPHEGTEFSVDQRDTFTVGRSSRVNFPMTHDQALSREHFQLKNEPPICYLLDLGSTNGTKVNGMRVGRVALREMDVITAGDSVFEVRFLEDSEEALKFANCAGCAGRIPVSSTLSQLEIDVDTPPERVNVWLCDECQSRKRKFPATIPDYLIEEWIGSGGMGEVYRARQLSRKRPVAIKMISAHNVIGAKAGDYFRREVEILRNLLMPNGDCHPGIVAFYDIFEIQSQIQLVMEFVDGRNAFDWIEGRDAPLPIASAAQIGRQLLSALEYAHSKGYVHRDVKPSNLLVMGPVHRLRVKLTDFGLAKSFVDASKLSTLTRQGDIGGSVGFISPDHIRDFSDVRAPADIYSAAATLFYLLTNKYPYLGFDPRGTNAYEIILEHPPVPLRAFRPDAPESLERVLLKALQKHPRERWKSAQAMADALGPLAQPSIS